MTEVGDRVLIVEDELIVQMHLSRIVTELGHDVVGAAADRREALKVAESERPGLVLMDVQLAGGDDGVETAQLLSDRFGCAVVFVTANGDVDTVKRAVPVAAAGYLVKPFSDSDVRAAVTTALAGHSRLREARQRETSLAAALAAGGAAVSVPRRDRVDRPASDERLPFGEGTRLLVYSHDTFGLGHLKRSLKLIAGLHRRFDGLSVLLVTGSPMVHREPMPPGTDYLKLPAVKKVARSSYEARSLAISGGGIHRLRSNLLLRAVRDYAPNALIVDHAPTGMKGELRPALEWLGRKGGCVRILGLRDAIDSKDAVVEDFTERGIYDVMRDHYDHVVVYGSRAVFDPVAEYRFPDEVADKAKFVGYVCDGTPTGAKSSASKSVVVTAGGGDGGTEQTLGTFLAMVRTHRERIDYRATLIMGPFVDPDLRRRFEEEARDLPVEVLDYVPSTAQLLSEAEVVVATAGYNTCTDLLAHARRAVLVPRVMHRKEQLVRATRLAELGLVSAISPEEVTPERMFEAIEYERARGERLGESRRLGQFALDGVERFADFCATLEVTATGPA